jgi:imidazolonepropionase-like amidohydrolase
MRVTVVAAVLVARLAEAQAPTIIRAGRLFDGRGGVQQNVLVFIRNGRIERVGGPLRPGEVIAHDLRAYTLLPGFIDTHVHIDSHFGPDGRATNQGETPAQRAYAAAQNAYVTHGRLHHGVELGSTADSALATAIERGTSRDRGSSRRSAH